MIKVIAHYFLIALMLITPLAHAKKSFYEHPEVKDFIKKMVKKHKFSEKELTTLFSKVHYQQSVMQQFQKPLEANPWQTYQLLFVNEWRIKHGVEFWNKHERTLKKAEKIYGVPASIIVATIGIETKYGQRKGDFPVINALSSIAFSNSSRAPYFRRELEEFLLLTREEKLNPLTVLGSYAGAMGQPQFMPSSYRHYAINFSKSGKTDLMNNEVDVIGSIANYYKKHGWQTKQPIAIPTDITHANLKNINTEKQLKKLFTLNELNNLGIRPKNPLSNNEIKLSLIELPGTEKNEYWLGYHNFTVIKRYNPNDLYAMAVFQLSNYITNLKQREKINHDV